MKRVRGGDWVDRREPRRSDPLTNFATPAHDRQMATMNVSLPDPMKSWVETRTRDGRYSNVSDYMRDLIRRDQEREQAISEIQALIDEGLKSGAARDFDMSGFLARKTAE